MWKSKRDSIDWDRLMEDKGFGNFKVQQHVTPHIGFSAKLFMPHLGHSHVQEASDPSYNYTYEAIKVVEEVKKPRRTKHVKFWLFYGQKVKNSSSNSGSYNQAVSCKSIV